MEGKTSKTTDFNPVTLRQRRAHHVEYPFDNQFDIASWQSGIFSHLFDQIRLGHDSSNPEIKSI